ncbi:hypothetical protein Csa_018216 [Cucumis sativus]|nr:hypothetical protein Csa_018216 [Cucumis sativus]
MLRRASIPGFSNREKKIINSIMALEKAKKIVAFNPVTVFWFLFRSFSYEYFCFLRIFPDYKRVDVFVFFTARVIVHYAVQVKRLFHYAVQVKRLLTKLGVNFKAIELDTETNW